jgi:hypothetical protein
MSLNSQCPLFLSTINPLDYLRLNSAGTAIQGAGSSLSADPSTATLVAAGEGYTWYNTTSHQWKGWNGTTIVVFG